MSKLPVPRIILIPLVIAGLLLLPSCSSSECKDVEATLKKLDAEFVADYNIAKTRVNSRDTWVPVINKGLDLTNYALNNETCIGSEATAKWQTMKQNLSLKLESWIR